jgi:geranylgeranyl pyrophosphate synthase
MFLKTEIKEICLDNNIPQISEELRMMRFLVDIFLSKKKLTPPLLKEDVLSLSFDFIKKHPEYQKYQKLLAVIINNYAWKPIVAGIPYNRRILLLPQCMRHVSDCPAKTDELGLMCEECGLCSIAEISEQAEKFGYHVIVSEGTTAVKLLLSSGKVECVIGIGCLDSFERSFPLTIKEAVPSLAIPLFNSDCKNSRVDLEWLKEILPIKNDYQWNGWINLDNTRNEIQSWFKRENLESLFGNTVQSKNIANNWLETGGKRWRPMIMVSLCKTLCNEKQITSDILRKLAVSVECFHKASLVHDDIADNDPERYGKPTLHVEYDMPVALNTGDLLTGYGYQMIAESGASAEQMAKLLSIAAMGHRDLCLGQGEELLLRNKSSVLSVEKVLEIFSNKTSPAFEVALKFGAVVGNADDKIMYILGQYSKVLGIAYQIKDDLEDFTEEGNSDGFNAFHPSLITAILNEKVPEKTLDFMNRIHGGDKNSGNEFRQWANDQNAIDEAQKMLEHYKQQALEVLVGLENVNVKVLLYRLANRILG